MNNNDKPPPSDPTSEAALLGSIFSAHEHPEHTDFDLDTIRGIVNAEMFYTPQHAKLFQVVLDAADAGEPYTDPVVVLSKLQARHPGEANWEETLSSLLACAEPANTGYYGKSIYDSWRRRSIIRECQRTAESAYNPVEPVDAILAEHARNLPSVAADNHRPPTVGELRERYPRLREPLVYDLLRQGEAMNVIAPPKTGKSWLALSLAISVSSGRRWLDRFNVNPGPVLVIDNELHDETLADRVPRVAEALGVKLADVLDSIQLLSLRGHLRPISTLKTFCNPKPSLIVLDAFYRFLLDGVSENDNSAMARIYSDVDHLAESTGASIVLIHHSSKGSQSDKAITDVGAGAGAQSRAADTHLILRPHEEPGCCTLEAVTRSWPPLEPFVLRWTFPIWEIADGLDPAALRGAKRQDTREQGEWELEDFVDVFFGPNPRPAADVERRALAPGVNPRLSVRKVRNLIASAESAGLIYLWKIRTGKTRRHEYATVAQPGEPNYA